MKKDLLVLSLAVYYLILSLPVGAVVLADDLKPLLIDVIGWQAQDASDARTAVSGMKMINVLRRYIRSSKEFDAVIMVGANAMAYQGNMEEVSSETADGSVRIKKIKGFHVQSVFDKKEKAGAVIIFLGRKRATSAVFMINYNGLSEQDALAVAKKFSWAKMQRAVIGLM